MNPQANDNVIDRRPHPHCDLCGATGEFLYRGLKDCLFGAPGEWNLKKCPNPECGLVWLDPMPVEEDIGKAYLNYYTHQKAPGNERGRLGNMLRSGLRIIYDLLLIVTLIEKERKRRNFLYLDKTTPGKLLEIGCGDGGWLAGMRQSGWEVEGQEVDPEAARQARNVHGLQVYLGPLEKAGLPDSTFDAVTMNHVIEHVHDPVTLLAECRRILKPDGILVAVTPNTESLGHSCFMSSWRGLEPPRHLHLFSPKTLEGVAKSAGFEAFETWTSAAKAGVVAAGSIDIEMKGDHDKSRTAPLTRMFPAALFQLRAVVYHAAQNGSGEECVLRAGK